jgi:hypothetical protein
MDDPQGNSETVSPAQQKRMHIIVGGRVWPEPRRLHDWGTGVPRQCFLHGGLPREGTHYVSAQGGIRPQKNTGTTSIRSTTVPGNIERRRFRSREANVYRLAMYVTPS